MSDHVDRGISELGMVENVGVVIDISLLSHASPEITMHSGLNAASLFLAVGGCRSMSMMYSRIGHGRKYGVAVGISLITCPEQ